MYTWTANKSKGNIVIKPLSECIIVHKLINFYHVTFTECYSSNKWPNFIISVEIYTIKTDINYNHTLVIENLILKYICRRPQIITPFIKFFFNLKPISDVTVFISIITCSIDDIDFRGIFIHFDSLYHFKSFLLNCCTPLNKPRHIYHGFWYVVIYVNIIWISVV